MEAVERRKKRTNELGPTGERLAANLAKLRGRQPSTRELSRRLTELGQPIPPTGITKIEAAQRRVDADDIVALSVALSVTPNRLLLPPTAREDFRVALTDTVSVNENQAWRWARGEVPLPPQPVGDDDVRVLSETTPLEFQLANRPDEPPTAFIPHDIAEHAEDLHQLHTILSKLHQKSGWSDQQMCARAHLAAVGSFIALPGESSREKA